MDPGKVTWQSHWSLNRSECIGRTAIGCQRGRLHRARQPLPWHPQGLPPARRAILCHTQAVPSARRCLKLRVAPPLMPACSPGSGSCYLVKTHSGSPSLQACGGWMYHAGLYLRPPPVVWVLSARSHGTEASPQSSRRSAAPAQLLAASRWGREQHGMCGNPAYHPQPLLPALPCPSAMGPFNDIIKED